jgi:RHS repeat-associated protein
LEGELVAEYAANAAPATTQKEYGYRAGELLVTAQAAVAGSRSVQWTVADHLGTPRMVVDRTGGSFVQDMPTTKKIVGVSRHDYLPFGEELAAGVEGRTTQQGYGGSDGVRQSFTGYEKDDETGLNFAQARYHSPTQGRFTSVDPFNPILEFRPDPEDDEEEQEEVEQQFNDYLGQPQHWNRYAYALNNPLAYVDRDGNIPVLIPVALVIIRVAPAAIAAARYLSSPQGQRAIQMAQRYGTQLGQFTLTRGRAISNDVFKLQPFLRGRVIEGLRGAPDLFAKNFPKIDNFNFRRGIATSIKSLDINALSYQSINRLGSTLTNYVNQLAGFRGGNLPGGAGSITANMINRRILEVILPAGRLSNAQQQVLLRVQQDAARRGIEVRYFQTQ